MQEQLARAVGQEQGQGQKHRVYHLTTCLAEARNVSACRWHCPALDFSTTGMEHMQFCTAYCTADTGTGSRQQPQGAMDAPCSSQRVCLGLVNCCVSLLAREPGPWALPLYAARGLRGCIVNEPSRWLQRIALHGRPWSSSGSFRGPWPLRPPHASCDTSYAIARRPPQAPVRAQDAV